MAKKDEKSSYKYKSRFGSHKEMIVEDTGDGEVVCEDEFGIYTTRKDRIDSGLADPNRYAESRLDKLIGSKKKD